MAFLTDADRTRIAEAIRAAEARTSGEFVAVVTARADHYFDFLMLDAALCGLLAAESEPWWGGWGAPSALLVGLAVAAAVALLLALAPTLRVRLVPDPVRRRRCRALAARQFVARDMARTKGRTGVLLFVAVDERCVEVIADAGIHAKVAAGFWDGIVADLGAGLRAGRVADGFVGAITAAGAALATHFPRAADDADELPDHLIEI